MVHPDSSTAASATTFSRIVMVKPPVVERSRTIQIFQFKVFCRDSISLEWPGEENWLLQNGLLAKDLQKVARRSSLCYGERPV